MAKALSIPPARSSFASRLTMLLGIAIFPSLSSIGLEMSAYATGPLSGSFLLYSTLALALGGAFFARRPSWRLSVLVALLGTLASLFLLSREIVIVATPWGAEMQPREAIGAYPAYYARLAKSQATDLRLIDAGARAAKTGHPLPAPEGGYLVPKRVEASQGDDSPHPTQGYDSPYRFAASPTPDVGEAWNEAFRRQSRALAETRLQERLPMVDSPVGWLQQGFGTLLVTLVLGFSANLAALLGRAVLGAAR